MRHYHYTDKMMISAKFSVIPLIALTCLANSGMERLGALQASG